MEISKVLRFKSESPARVHSKFDATRMKSISLIILFFAFETIFGSNIHSYYEGIARFKREAVEDGSACLLSCIEAMEDELNTVKSARTQRTRYQQSSVSTCQRYEPDQLDALCSSHGEAKKCLEECPDGEMRAVGMNALAPLNFMCVDRFQDFKKHLPCLDSICEHVEMTCQPSCRQYKTSVDKLTEIQRDVSVRQAADVPAVTKVVSDACEFIDCFNGCSRPLIVEKCGVGAANLQRDTVRKAFASVTSLLSSVATSDDTLPSSCHNLASSSEADSNSTQSPSFESPTTVKKGDFSSEKRHRSNEDGNFVTPPQSDLIVEQEFFNSGVAVKMPNCVFSGWIVLIIYRLL